MILPDADVAFYLAAAGQLPPPARLLFEERVRAILQPHPDPGPGTVNAAVRQAFAGLWTPPPDEAVRGTTRWSRDTPRFERASKRDW